MTGRDTNHYTMATPLWGSIKSPQLSSSAWLIGVVRITGCLWHLMSNWKFRAFIKPNAQYETLLTPRHCELASPKRQSDEVGEAGTSPRMLHSPSPPPAGRRTGPPGAGGLSQSTRRSLVASFTASHPRVFFRPRYLVGFHQMAETSLHGPY